DGVIKEQHRRLMLVADEIYQAQSDQRPFINIEQKPIARFDRVTHADFRVAVLAVKQFQEKRGVVPARGRESVLVDRRDLFLQLRVKFLLLERALCAEFDYA